MRGKSYILRSFTSHEVQDVIKQLFTQNRYDAVLFGSALMAGYLVPENVKIVIDQPNIEHELLLRTYQRETSWVRKWYNWLEARLVKPVEMSRCQKSDLVLVTSEREQLALKSMLQGKTIEVVPNGVDIEYFNGNDIKQNVPGRIIFTGAMDYYPNVDAVQLFAQKCWPIIQNHIPDATWHIVGRNPLPEVRKLSEVPGITVTGSVPDVRPYLAAAEVAIVPLRIGGGTRLKILEAFAMRKAVVSTSIGCEGLSVDSNTHLVVEDQPQKFALAVVKLLSGSKERISFGVAGRRLVEAEYSWERCGDSLLRALEQLG
jgi:sugar transferase (PEP-CTERM/EpsH1 system associated)